MTRSWACLLLVAAVAAPREAAAQTATSASIPSTATAGPIDESDARDDEVDEAEEVDRTRWFWLEASFGYSWVNLAQLSMDDNFGVDTTLLKSSGLTGSAGLGIQLSVIRLGVAGSWAQHEAFDVATAEADVAVMIPIPVVQPYIRAGFGYAWVGQLQGQTPAMTPFDYKIRGIAIDVGVGLDVDVSDVVQLGVAVDASFLNLQRQKVTNPMVTDVDLATPGNAVGLQIAAEGRVTFRF